MSEQIKTTRQTWPESTPLLHVKRPRDGGIENPADVRGIGDLPSTMLLGALDRESFRRSDDAWHAVYRSNIPDTACALSYDVPAQEFTVRWTYRNVVCSSGKVNGEKFTHVLRATNRDAPARLLAELTRSIEGPLNLIVPGGMAEQMNYLYYPDGFLMAVACPVPVCRLAVLPDVMRDIDGDDRISAYVSADVQLRWSVVNYVEGLNKEPMTDPLSADAFTIKQTGLPPFEVVIWETNKDGARALTVRRRHYVLTLSAFLGDIELVISHLVGHGLIANGGDRESYAYPDGHEFAGLVMPRMALNVPQRINTFDDRKTRRLVTGRTADDPRVLEPSDEEYDPQRYQQFARSAETATADMYTELGLA